MHEELNAMTRTVPDIRFQKPMMMVARIRMRKRGRSTDTPQCNGAALSFAEHNLGRHDILATGLIWLEHQMTDG